MNVRDDDFNRAPIHEDEDVPVPPYPATGEDAVLPFLPGDSIPNPEPEESPG